MAQNASFEISAAAEAMLTPQIDDAIHALADAAQSLAEKHAVTLNQLNLIGFSPSEEDDQRLILTV